MAPKTSTWTILHEIERVCYSLIRPPNTRIWGVRCKIFEGCWYSPTQQILICIYSLLVIEIGFYDMTQLSAQCVTPCTFHCMDVCCEPLPSYAVADIAASSTYLSTVIITGGLLFRCLPSRLRLDIIFINLLWNFNIFYFSHDYQSFNIVTTQCE